MTNVCLKRLQKEFIAIKKSPVDNVIAVPNESNMLEWHYVIFGPKDTPYEDGVYHGVLRFPQDYPYKPPSILMYTKNGRFKTHTRLCLSMSDYHPETWNPMWSVSSILSGLLSFMIDNQPTLGSIEASDSTRRAFAQSSMKENCADATFRKLFPELVQREKNGGGKVSSSSATVGVSTTSTTKKTEEVSEPVTTAEVEAAAPLVPSARDVEKPPPPLVVPSPRNASSSSSSISVRNAVFLAVLLIAVAGATAAILLLVDRRFVSLSTAHEGGGGSATTTKSQL